MKDPVERVSLVSEFCGEMVVKESSPFHTMCINPLRPGPNNRSHKYHSVLCDTGATSSIVSLKIATELGLVYNKNESVTVRGTNGIGGPCDKVLPYQGSFLYCMV